MSRRSNLLEGLNPEQRDAVCTTDGPLLILAGAGSGKTRVITTRIAHLLQKQLASAPEILAVTFTNKAAAEMRERVGRLVGGKLAKEIALSTFHSFCVRVLREEIAHLGYRRNFTISSESDARTLLRRSLDGFDGHADGFDAGIYLQEIGAMKSSGVEPEKYRKADAKETVAKQEYRKWLPEVYERYQSALRAANSVDFDDLLLLTLRLWREHPRILGRYQQQFRYVMVDEYQDTNRVQYDLLVALASKRRNLCVVGDDDQSIYSWRGADIRNITGFEKDFPEAKIIRLEQNYRSTSTILKAANTVIAHNVHRREKNLWSQLGEGRNIDWFVTGDEEQEAAEVVAWLQHIQSKADAKAADFAVLFRSNLQSRPFEIAFRQANIPYVVIGGQEFFERAEIKDLVAYLKVIANPRDEASFLRVVNMPRRGIGDATLHQVHELCLKESISLVKALARVLEQGGLPANTSAGVRSFLTLLREFRERFKAGKDRLSDIVNDLVEKLEYRTELFRTCKSKEHFQARWANVEALLAAVVTYETSSGNPSLSGFLDNSALTRDEDRRGKEERMDAGVKLMTIHSAKGLEFPFVFVVGVEEGLLPHEKSVSVEAVEEERRLFYVALTRGKRHVTLFEALSRQRYGRERMTKTSRFALEIPESLVNKRMRAAREMVQERVDPPEPKPKRHKGRSGMRA